MSVHMLAELEDKVVLEKRLKEKNKKSHYSSELLLCLRLNLFGQNSNLNDNNINNKKCHK